ncbi:MAG: hypothetical protein LBV58_00745 [Acholeplasmatales bacterium]|jgi:electron transport complex protein RnfB|nr:hypothetical protein [Acholeplasmatales bacterium]
MTEILFPVLVLLGIGALLGALLALANKLLEVKEDERIGEIAKLLPNYNCGSCGTPGCVAFATAIIEGEVKNLSRCKPGKADKNFNPIIEYLKAHPDANNKVIDVKI